MRIIRFVDEQGQTHLGRDQGDGQTTPTSAELLDGQLFGPLQPTGRNVAVARLLAPLDPVNIFCIGVNYLEHARESGAEVPEHPVLFMKPTTALNHPGQPIRIPKACDHGPEVDYECELAVVIGKQARDVSENDALGHVLGYTAAHDVSARRWQKHGGGGQWIRGKGFDTFCPLGPAIVTPGPGDDEIPDPQNLAISTTINGKVMQSSNTSDMIHPVAKLIAFISRDTTLLPGTVILTGTPPGVGFARKPPVALTPGDEVVIEVERIGKLVNPVA